ncbi:MAG: glycosyltransferase family 9 protein [Candidatus Omnitrophica bacterium]|nr:glycosyltransferase family 9 protein [Candidatus Omnitrophota bacterium]
MIIDKTQVKRILVITLSNVGDIILTTPVIKALAKEFPGIRLDVMVGPQGKEIFEKDPHVFKVIIYDKHLPIGQKRRLQLKLKKLKYDLVVDIRNTVFPLLIGPRFRTATIQNFPHHIIHRKLRHLYRLKSVGIEKMEESPYIHTTSQDDEYIDRMLKENDIVDPIVVMNAGAKSHLKRWTAGGFAEVAERLMAECRASVVFVGLNEDEAIVKEVISRMNRKPHNFVNKTNIRQLASLLKRSRLLITNDSAPLHLGCAVGVKVVALFGPTDPRKYGPTGEFDVVITEKLSCAPCECAQCARNYECMRLISPDAVFDAAKMMIEGYE